MPAACCQASSLTQSCVCLLRLRNQLEIVIVVSAEDIEKNKVRADLGITYDEDVLRLREEFQSRDFMVGSVVITHYNGQHTADQFRHRLERMGIKSYVHYLIDGYPHNVEPYRLRRRLRQERLRGDVT